MSWLERILCESRRILHDCPSSRAGSYTWASVAVDLAVTIISIVLVVAIRMLTTVGLLTCSVCLAAGSRAVTAGALVPGPAARCRRVVPLAFKDD
jgi:hypothetical protein